MALRRFVPFVRKLNAAGSALVYSTYESIPASNIAVDYAVGSNIATFSFPGYPYGVLPNGTYRVTLPPQA